MGHAIEVTFYVIFCIAVIMFVIDKIKNNWFND